MLMDWTLASSSSVAAVLLPFLKTWILRLAGSATKVAYKVVKEETKANLTLVSGAKGLPWGLEAPVLFRISLADLLVAGLLLLASLTIWSELLTSSNFLDWEGWDRTEQFCIMEPG